MSASRLTREQYLVRRERIREEFSRVLPLARISDDPKKDRIGTCCIRKANDIADAMGTLPDAPLIVEIGVWRGSSFLRLAGAARVLGGRAVGIDPYAKYEQHAVLNESVNALIQSFNFDAEYVPILKRLHACGLASTASIVRTKSEDAATLFDDESIDCLHIDGNHAEDAVRRDFELYLPKMKRGGIVIVDDVTWPSVVKMFMERIVPRVSRVFWGDRIFDRASTDNDCTVFSAVILSLENDTKNWSIVGV